MDDSPSLLGRSLLQTVVSPPEESDDDNQQDQKREIEAFEYFQEEWPLSPKKVTRQRNGGCPDDGAKKVEEQEAGPRKVHRSGEGPRHDAQSRDEPRKENRQRPIPTKYPFRPLYVVSADIEALGVFLQEGSPAATTDPIPQVVPNGCSANCNHNDPLDPEVYGIAVCGEKSGNQKDRFPGDGQTGIFQHNAEEHSPVAVPDKKFNQFSED